MDFASLTVGVGLVIAGVGLLLWRKKRKFDRTNRAGIEQFHSFGVKIRARLLDGVLTWLSLICLFSGLLSLSLQFESSWGWVVLIPVYAVLLLLVL